jgi:hypothetical protein
MNLVLLKPLSGAEMQTKRQDTRKPKLFWYRKNISGAIDYETDWRVDLHNRICRDRFGSEIQVNVSPEGEWTVGLATSKFSDRTKDKAVRVRILLAALQAWKAAQADELVRGATKAEQAPAKLHAGLVVQLVHRPRIGTFRRVRNTKESVILSYKENGQINQSEYDAGEAYEKDFQLLFASGKDSLDFGVGGKPSSFAPVSQAQADAMTRLIAIESRLSQCNRKIVRMVCGENHWASYAVRHVTKEDAKAFAMPRFREAMRCLVSASARAKGEGWTFWQGTPIEPEKD